MGAIFRGPPFVASVFGGVVAAPGINNTALPTIVADPLLGNNVVGAVLNAMPGSWSGSPTTFTYQWLRDGSVISGATGSSYTLVESDRTKAITVSVIASKVGTTSAPAISSPTAAVRRTAATLSYRYGKLSRTGYGKVALANASLGLLGAGVTAPSTWTTGTATTGTDGHFTKSGGYTPVASGNGSVTGTTYVFPLTATFADSVVETSTLTITAVDNVVTFNPQYEEDWILGSLEGVVEGKTLEIATGTPDGTGLTIVNFRGASYTTIKYADAARPTALRHVSSRGNSYLIFEGLKTKSTASLAGTEAAYFFVSDNGADGVASDHITFNGATHIGTLSDMQANLSSSGTAPPFFGINNGDYITFNDAFGDYAYNGFKQGGRASNVVVNRFVIRHYADNGWILGHPTAPTSIVMNDWMAISPMRIPGDTTHTDGGQSQDSANGGSIVLNRGIIAQADGNGGTQGLQLGDREDLGSGPVKIDINGLIVVIGRQYNGINCSKANSNVFKNITMWNTNSGDITAEDPLVDYGPWVVLAPSPSVAGTSSFDSSIVFGTVTNNAGSSWTIGSKVTAYNASRLAPPSGVAGVAFAGDPTALLNGLTTAQWAAFTPAQIKAYVMNALTPKVGGAIADRGAVGTDGNWIADAQ